MHELNRRGVLAGIASLAAAPLAEGASDPIAARVSTLHRRWEEEQREMTLSFIPDGRFSVDDPVVVSLSTISRGFTAVPVLHDLAELPVEEQAHPGVQQSIRELSQAFGKAILRCRDLMTSFLDGAQDGDFVQLHGALRVLRLSTAEWNISPHRRDLLKDGFNLAEAEDDPHARRCLKRTVRRINKLESLVNRAMSESRPSALLGRASRRQEEQVARGIARHGATPAIRPGSDSDEAARNVGMVLLGVVGMVIGVVLILSGICTVGCGSPAGILLILAGIGIIALSIWAFTSLSRRIGLQVSADAGRPSQWAIEDDAAPSSVAAVNVHVGDGWTASSLRRSPEGPLRIQARGRVYGPWGWLASPDGDGVAAGPEAPLPGAPELGLLARIDGKIIFLGADGEIPPGPSAVVELRLNVGSLGSETTLGYFHVVPA